ncbi:dihydrodipicolinate synthase family protein [Salsuginibacillus kocurii]|uniref:dihydrodipicolinate synthase family protein n=1 Tax=Salsuginibacillus kocurii TaxID=427078 RepID=UPI00037CFC9E|nr:dihydrodipicolinate synthase family protein [Salsuginibacillus kocurii]
MANFEGVHVALVTPFTTNYEVDYERMTELCNWLIDKGVDGLIPVGSLGEYTTLEDEERAQVVETVIEAANGRVPVVVGTGAPSTSKVIKWAEHAKASGAAGLMALPPINYNPLEEEVIQHFKELSNVGLPVIAYNNPRDYPTDLTPDLLRKISAFENIVSVKEFSGDIRRVHDILDQTNLEVMIGVDDLAFEGAIAGASGWISGVPNILPQEGKKLFEMGQNGAIEDGLRLYRELLPLFHYDAEPQLVQSIKHMMELGDMDCGPTRPPRLPLSKKHYEKIERDFQRAKNYSILQ